MYLPWNNWLDVEDGSWKRGFFEVFSNRGISCYSLNKSRRALLEMSPISGDETAWCMHLLFSRGLNAEKFDMWFVFLKKIAFKRDIIDSDLFHHPSNNLEELVLQFLITLRALLDRHAPVKTKQIRARSSAPWMTDQIRYAKRQKWKAKRLASFENIHEFGSFSFPERSRDIFDE